MCLVHLEYFSVFKNMSRPPTNVGSFKRCVLTGVRREPAWSELSGQLQFLKYAEETSGTFVVYAYGNKIRESAWKNLFGGAETVTPITDFGDCERYCRLRDEGRLKTLGEPIRKDVSRDLMSQKNESNARNKEQNVTSVEECKAVTLCKRVEAAKFELLYLPARLGVAKNMNALLDLLQKTAEQGTWAETASDLALLMQKKRDLWREWLAFRPVYEAKVKQYTELKKAMWEARAEENARFKRAKAEWQNMQEGYPIEDSANWSAEDADKLGPCYRQWQESRKRKRWLRDWLDDYDKARDEEQICITRGKAEYKRLRRLMQRSGVPEHVPQSRHMPLHMPLPVSVELPRSQHRRTTVWTVDSP